MKKELFEKIESFEAILEELKLQLLELTVTRDNSEKMHLNLTEKLTNTSNSLKRMYYRKHIDLLLEGISVVRRDINAIENNLEFYQNKFQQLLKG